MQETEMDLNHELMLDGNAAAGMLQEIFAVEMTAAPAECANCGNQARIGALLAFTQGPGIVLRCPACQSVVLRIVETPNAIYLDARGAVHLRLARPRTEPPIENDSLGG
jgi:Zn finger protein HypA/HybF involved in hydrogenase expression